MRAAGHRGREFFQAADLAPGLHRLVGAMRRDAQRWIAKGCISPAPTLVKVAIVRTYACGGRNCFVETGTYLGKTLGAVARGGSRCISIEIDDAFATRAKRVFRRMPNVTILHGDSSNLIHSVAGSLTEDTTFWLDGYYSGGVTGGGDKAPISRELAAIFSSGARNHVVLIDDCSLV